MLSSEAIPDNFRRSTENRFCFSSVLPVACKLTNLLVFVLFCPIIPFLNFSLLISRGISTCLTVCFTRSKMLGCLRLKATWRTSKSSSPSSSISQNSSRTTTSLNSEPSRTERSWVMFVCRHGPKATLGNLFGFTERYDHTANMSCNTQQTSWHFRFCYLRWQFWREFNARLSAVQM